MAGPDKWKVEQSVDRLLIFKVTASTNDEDSPKRLSSAGTIKHGNSIRAPGKDRPRGQAPTALTLINVLQITTAEAGNFKLETRNSELGTQNSELGTQNSELGTQNSELVCFQINQHSRRAGTTSNENKAGLLHDTAERM